MVLPMSGPPTNHEAPSPRAAHEHASSLADLAVAAVLAVAALIGHARYGGEDFASPLQYVLWAFAAAHLARSVVRWAAIELTKPAAR